MKTISRHPTARDQRCANVFEMCIDLLLRVVGVAPGSMTVGVGYRDRFVVFSWLSKTMPHMCLFRGFGQKMNAFFLIPKNE